MAFNFDDLLEVTSEGYLPKDTTNNTVEDTPIGGPKFEAYWDSHISKMASKYPNVPENIVRSLIARESSGNIMADIYTGNEKYGYARGLGQFIDSTAPHYIPDWKDPSDSYDPYKNIEGIYRYLDDLINQTGSIKTALIKYHGGDAETPDVLKTSSGDYADQILSNATKSSIIKPKDPFANKDIQFDASSLIGDTSTIESPTVEQQPQQSQEISNMKEGDGSWGDMANRSLARGLAGVANMIGSTISTGAQAVQKLTNKDVATDLDIRKPEVAAKGVPLIGGVSALRNIPAVDKAFDTVLNKIDQFGQDIQNDADLVQETYASTLKTQKK
jgi:hypothetical protein